MTISIYNPKPNRLDCLSMNFAIRLQWAVKSVQIAHQMHIYGLEAVKQQCFSIISEVSRIITQVKNNNHDSED